MNTIETVPIRSAHLARAFFVAVAMAALAELPLAYVCWRIAWLPPAAEPAP